MLLGNASRGRIVATEVVKAPLRVRGLWSLRTFPPKDGRAMRFLGAGFWASFAPAPVDVVFLDARGRVVGLAPRLRPWRAAGPFAGATNGVCLAAGTIERIPIRDADFLEWTPTTGERVAAGAKPPEHF